jgi:hypothetical protein
VFDHAAAPWLQLRVPCSGGGGGGGDDDDDDDDDDDEDTNHYQHCMLINWKELFQWTLIGKTLCSVVPINFFPVHMMG